MRESAPAKGCCALAKPTFDVVVVVVVVASTSSPAAIIDTTIGNNL
jgi:hypothetical protein